MLVGFVVLIFPRCATTVTAVTRDGDLAGFSGFFAVAALNQFGMAGGTPPIALNACAGFTEHHFFQFILNVRFNRHVGTLSDGCRELRPSFEETMKKALCTEIQSAFKFGGTSGGRTHDKRIKSPLLYQLSYGPNAVVQRTAARLRL